MAEKHWSDERETEDVLDFGGYHTQDENTEYGIRTTSVVSAVQKKTQSIRRENDTHLGTGSIYPITVSSAPAFSTVEASIYTTESNNSPSTGGHELLVVRSTQEQHDYDQQDIDKLKKKNRELKQIKICVICRNKDFEYVIQPCGHLTCDACSKVDICICNAYVTGKHVSILSR